MTTQDKRQSIKIVVLPSGVMQFNTPAGGFNFDPSGCTDDVERMATIKGYKEKISNKAALPAGTSWAVKLKAMKEVAERLAAGGVWNLRGVAVSALDRDALFQAVATAKNISLDSILAKWGNMGNDFLQVRLTDKDVAAEYARLTVSGTSDEGMFQGLED